MGQRAPITVRVFDTSFGIWQDNANDPSFRSEVFGPLLRILRDLGWSVRENPEVKKHYTSLSPNCRLASNGTLRATIELSGRVIEIGIWATSWPIENRAGRRYDFNKLKRMQYLERLRVQALHTKLIAWLETLGPVSVASTPLKRETALEAIQRSYAECWHTNKELGRPVCEIANNATSKDGQRIQHGSVVWFADRNGRILRGTAYYHINSMWWVVCAKYDRRNLSCKELYCTVPENLRAKHNDRKRRARLEIELTKAIRGMNFKRAEVLKRILFGQEETYLIWSRKKGAYYRSNCEGYSSDSASAGRYTREEAEAEVRRVPHHLEAIGANGERIRFEEGAHV